MFGLIRVFSAILAITVYSVSISNAQRSLGDIVQTEMESTFNEMEVITQNVENALDDVRSKVSDNLWSKTDSAEYLLNDLVRQTGNKKYDADDVLYKELNSAHSAVDDLFEDIVDALYRVSDINDDVRSNFDQKLSDASYQIQESGNEATSLIGDLEYELRDAAAQLKDYNGQILGALRTPKNTREIFSLSRAKNGKILAYKKLLEEIRTKLPKLVNEKKAAIKEQMTNLQKFVSENEGKLKEEQNNLQKLGEQALIKIEGIQKATSESGSSQVQAIIDELRKQVEHFNDNLKMDDIKNDIASYADQLKQMNDDYIADINQRLEDYQNILTAGIKKATPS